MRAKNNKLPWSRRDVRVLRQCAKQRKPAWKAAEQLKRTPGATRYKAMVEGVSFRSINRRPAR